MWEEAFQDLLKSCVCFRWGLEGSNKEKMGRQQKQEVLKWNVRKTRLRAAGDHLLKLHVLLGDCEWGWGKISAAKNGAISKKGSLFEAEK